MDKKCTLTNNSPNDWSDQDTFDVSTLFDDANPDLYKLDLNQIDEFSILRWNQETDECHLPTDVLAIGRIREDESDIPPSIPNFEPMDFLNFEEENEVPEGIPIGHNIDSLKCPSSLGPSEAYGLPTWQDGEHGEHHVRAINFLGTMDITTQKNYPSSPEYNAIGGDVVAREDYSASNNGEEGTDNGVLSANPRVPTQELVQCPRCHSFDTKFCYYNNRSLNQSRRLCKSCQRQWTVGGTLRPRNPKSTGVRRRRGRKLSQIGLDGGESSNDGPEEHSTGSGGLPRASNGSGPRPGSRSKNRNKQPVSKRKSVPSPIYALASDLTFLSFSSEPGETSTAAALLPSIDLSQLPSISCLRSDQEGLSASPSANDVQLASVENAAVQLAQNPPIYVGEPEPEFHAVMTTAAPYSLLELRKQHGPVTVSLIHQLQNTPLVNAALDKVQWEISQDLPFSDLGVSSPSQMLNLGLGQNSMPIETTVAPNGNDKHKSSEDPTKNQILNLNEKLTDNFLRELIRHPVHTQTSPDEGQDCELDRNFLMSGLQCTCATPLDCNVNIKAAESGEKHSSISKLTCTCAGSSTVRNPKKTKRFPSRLGIS